MIEVRIPMIEMLRELSAVEDKLVDAGVPPLGRRDGFVKSWQDVETNEFVYQYIPREEAMLPTSNPEGDK